MKLISNDEIRLALGKKTLNLNEIETALFISEAQLEADKKWLLDRMYIIEHNPGRILIGLSLSDEEYQQLKGEK